MDSKEFAKQAHQGQKYGDKPYFWHLEQVVSLVERFAPPEIKEQALHVAWLHDTLEDTEVSYDALVAKFGPLVARAVLSLSGKEGEKREQEFARLAGASALAKFVKACDLAANMAACVADRHEEYLAGYSSNLENYVKALGQGFAAELLLSCEIGAAASQLGLREKILKSERVGGDLGMYANELTVQVTWKLPTIKVSEGLITLGQEGGTTPIKTFKRFS